MHRLFVFLFIAAIVALPPACRRSPTKEPRYTFSTDWFSHKIPRFERYLAEFRDRPNVRALEIGSYEGRSAIWQLEHILTGQRSSLTCVDPFGGDLEKTFRANIREGGFQRKVSIEKGHSQEVLRTLPLATFDYVFIDGCHLARCVLSDAVLTWELLKPGGLLIFDDYGWELDRAANARPGPAIDAFLNAYSAELELVEKSYIVVVRKRKVDA